MNLDELEKLWGMDSSNSGLDATSAKSDGDERVNLESCAELLQL